MDGQTDMTNNICHCLILVHNTYCSTLEYWGNKAMATGRANPKAAVTRKALIGRWKRGLFFKNLVLKKKKKKKTYSPLHSYNILKAELSMSFILLNKAFEGGIIFFAINSHVLHPPWQLLLFFFNFQLNGIQRNLTGSKYSMSSTKFVILGPTVLKDKYYTAYTCSPSTNKIFQRMHSLVLLVGYNKDLIINQT